MPAMQALATAINRPQDSRHRCFPCNLSRCLPCLPSSWTKVQDWLHLVLIFGVLASMVCLIQMIYELGFGDKCRSPLCFKQWITGVIVLPSTIYFIQTIGRYDEQLQERKQRHEHEVERLIGNINEQVAEMNQLCANLADRANTFATGRFNDKSQAFKLFLHQVREAYADLYVQEEMLDQLRRFVIAWFRAFAGTVINPRDNPLLGGVERDLSRCTTVQALCDVAMKRLEGGSIAFRFQLPSQTPILQHRTLEDGSSAPSHSSSFLGGAAASRLCGVSWLRCGRVGCCRRERSANPSGMPVKFYFGCFMIKILSRSHVNLLLAFVADLLLVIVEVVEERWTSLALVITNVICITSLLACFEQINEIAQLEHQIHVYERRSAEVGQRRDEARSSWEKVQQLHDLWLYRTLPSLSIMGKIHTQLGLLDMERTRALANGSTEADPRPEFLLHANECLNCLQQRLGSLEDWRTAKEPLSELWKDTIGKQLRDCEDQGLEEVLQKLPIINTDLRNLEAPPPSASASGSFASTSSASGRP
mmetsp:Transcript_120544/g.336333  ORF Transcript_120544/g.336333 Transcript_120544/m.336333 type:complete len:534 (+) Transcript_120544:130-1731(+)